MFNQLIFLLKSPCNGAYIRKGTAFVLQRRTPKARVFQFLNVNIMVTFEKGKLIITCHTETPKEDWYCLISNATQLLQLADQTNLDKSKYSLITFYEFLENLALEPDQLK